MKRLYFVLVIAIAFLIPGFTFAQQLSDPPGPTDQQPLNFYELREQTLARWGGKVPSKGNGYKQFKRWEHFWFARVNVDGSFPAPGKSYREWNNYVQKHPEAKSSNSFVADWRSLGPITTTGGYAGIGRVNCIAFHPTNANIMWVGTPAGGLWKTMDGGSNWVPVTDAVLSQFSIGVSAILVDPNNPAILYIATGDKDSSTHFPYSVGILKSTDGGNTWNSTGPMPNAPEYYLVNDLIFHPVRRNTLYAATTAGIYRSENAGASWEALTGAVKVWDIAFNPGSSNILYASTDNQLYRSTDGGENWGQSRLDIPNSIRTQIAVSPDNASYVALVSAATDRSFNGFFESNNSGGSWRQKFGPRQKNLLTWDSQGQNEGGQGDYDLCIALSPTDYRTVFIGGVNLWKSTNGGSSWAVTNFWNTATGPGQNPGVATVHADKHVLAWRGNTLFEGNDGGIYRSDNMGRDWVDLSNTLVISQMYRLGLSQADNSVMTGLQDNGTKYKAGDGTWIDVIGGDGGECFFDPTNPGIAYAELNNGKLFRLTTNDRQEINIPTNQGDRGIGAWITPWTLDPNNRQTLYAGYEEIWKNSNSGNPNSWVKISPILGNNSNIYFRNIQSLAVAPSNSNTIYAATWNGIWRTNNGGGNWTDISAGLPLPPNLPMQVLRPLISYIAVNPENPSHLYLTLSQYVDGEKIYVSTNGGNSWTNISGSLPNVPANCIAVQPGGNDALYLGTDVGVFYRNAEMNDWIAFQQGLPNVIVTELECKASTSKIVATTYGRGLWEADFFSGSTPSNELSITPTVQNVDKSAGTVRFNIQSDQSWSLSENERWLSLSPTSGNGNATVSASYQVNTSRNAREAVITLSSESGSKTAKIIQQGSGGGGSACNQPSNLRVYEVGQTEASFSWITVSGAVSYTVSFRALPNGSWQTLDPEFLQSTSVNVSGFAAGTTYEWRVKSNCAGGQNSSLASGPHFTTDAAPTCPTPTNLQTSAISQDGATFSWTAVPGANSYAIQTRKGASGSWTNTAPATTTATAVSLSGLFSNTSYQWRVRTICANGLTSEWSNPQSFTTLPAAVCNTPIGLQTTNVTQSTVVIDWNLVNGATNYTLQLREGTHGQWANLNPATFTTGPVEISGLDANTLYQWRVRANCSNGLSSNWSGPSSFTTLPAPVCHTPGGLQTYNITATSVEVNWGLVNGASYYSLQTRISGGPWVNLSPPDWNFGPVVISGLFSNTNYQWRVRTVCTNGLTSNWSSPRSFTTLPPPTCNPPGNLYITNLTRNSVVLRWGAVNGAASYKVQFFGNSGWYDLPGGATVNNSLPVAGLWPNSTYFWRVIAFCSNGLISYPSGDAWFTTFAALQPQAIPKEAISRFKPQEIWPTQSLPSDSAYRQSYSAYSPKNKRIPFATAAPIPKAENQAVSAQIEELPLNIQVFPNPSEGLFQVQFENTSQIRSGQLFIYDATGRRLWRKAQGIIDGFNSWEIDARTWQNGLYMVRLLTADGRQAIQKIYISR